MICNYICSLLHIVYVNTLVLTSVKTCSALISCVGREKQHDYIKGEIEVPGGSVNMTNKQYLSLRQNIMYLSNSKLLR